MDLNNAEIAVTTQHLIDIKDYRDYWLHLSDYSDMGEFLSACSDLFPGEKEPNTEHTTDGGTHRGREPLPHKQECQSAVRFAVRLFQMVVRRRPFYPLATHGLQFNAVF